MQPAAPGQGMRRGKRSRMGAAALPARLWQAAPAGSGIAAWLHQRKARLAEALALEAERRRPFLWLPVAMGIGILLYFAADREPALWAPLVGLGLSGSLAFALRRRRAVAMACLALAATFAGFAAGVWRTAEIAAPMLERPRIGKLAGFVESVETRDGGGARLVLLVTEIAGVPAAERPQRARVNIRAGTVAPGDHIVATARLLPPPGPARAGGYDFGRDAFFRGIGAVGSIAGKVSLAPPPHPLPLRLTLDAAIDRARNALTQRIATVAGGQGGAVAAALVTGKRGLITEATNGDLRAAGIYHIVSISGLHMVLAAGTIFWLVRALLALSQTIALSWPVKKTAALAAMVGATAYCVFSGGEVATERSLIMTLVMLGAILVDRPALSMRNLALAAMIVLLGEPEALLGPSFQMSFGAVAALIAFAERWQNRDRAGPPRLPWPLDPLWTAALGIVVTTLLATAATAPFGAYHFQTFNPFGLLGNAMALPFVSLCVMPAAVFGVLAYPFGLDGPAWMLMGLATDVVLKVAHWVATIDHSTVTIAAFGPAVLACFALSLLWLTLWTTTWRWLAAVPLLLGVATAGKPEKPEILIERDGSGLAVRGADGRLVVAGKPSRFVLQQWLAADGDSRSPDDPSLRAGIACDTLACIARTADGRSISYARDRLAIIEDCLRADLVVTAIPWSAACKARLIDRTALSRDGATSLYRSGNGWSSRISERHGSDRLWDRRREIRRTPAASNATPASAPPDAEVETERLQ